MTQIEELKYVINKKALAALRAMSKTVSKWQYAHVSPKGVTCTDAHVYIRVSLPPQAKHVPTGAQIFTKDMLEEIRPVKDEVITMPVGLEAKTTASIYVPNLDCVLPDPSKEISHITLEAKPLIELLRAACEVTDHSKFLVRLRICKSGKNELLRIDAHHDEDGQEFVGVIMATDYNGKNISGDRPEHIPAHPTEVIGETSLNLPATEGRKFRD